jgi:predicted RNA-binding protein YlxR (DUF448 family)
MPNHSSHAGHISQRSCIICKKKEDPKVLLNFFVLNRDIIFDLKNQIKTRKRYVCYNEQCLGLVDKWLLKRQKTARPQTQRSK